jgi:hypothetical protein
VKARTNTDLLPRARRDGLTVEDLGDEILIYHHQRDVAHCLSATAATVWRACDGETTRAALIAASGLDAAEVSRGISELGALGLLEQGLAVQVHNGISRRQAVGRMAAVALAPLVVSVAAPTAMAAASRVARTACFDGTGSGINDCAAGTYCCESPRDFVTANNCCVNSGTDNEAGCCPAVARCCYTGTGNTAASRFCRPTALPGTPAGVTCLN